MNYEDYLSNAEKHYIFCYNVMSKKWQEQLVNDFKKEIVNKLFNSLKCFDKNHLLNKDNIPKLINSVLTNIDFSEDYSSIEPILIQLFDDLALKICGHQLTLIDTKKEEKKKNNYSNFVSQQYQEYRKKLYYIYLNVYYLSGYIFEGIAMYSVLKILGFDKNINLGGNATQRLDNLSNRSNYASQLSLYVISSDPDGMDSELRGNFAGINRHEFVEYIKIIQNNVRLESNIRIIEFVGQDINDNTLRGMVNNWNNNILRYKQFDRFDLSKTDIISLLELSNTIIEQVKHI